MALAALYKEAQLLDDVLPRPHGFIVDHRVRPESTEEAEWVAQQLRLKRETGAIVHLRQQTLTGHSWHGIHHTPSYMARRI